MPYISVRAGSTGVAARALGTPLDLTGPEQPRLGPPPKPLPSGPGAPLKLRPGLCHSQPCPLLSQLPDLFFLDEAWRAIAGSLSLALPPGWALYMCPSLVFSPAAGSCCSPLGLCVDPSPDSLSQFAEGCRQNLLVSSTWVPWDCSSGESIAFCWSCPWLLARSPLWSDSTPPSCSLASPIRTYIPFLKCMKQLWTQNKNYSISH